MNLWNTDWETPYIRLLETYRASPYDYDTLYKLTGETRAAMLNAGIKGSIDILGEMTLAIATGKNADVFSRLLDSLQKSVKKLKKIEKKA